MTYVYAFLVFPVYFLESDPSAGRSVNKESCQRVTAGIYLASSMGRSTLLTITGSCDIFLSSPCDALGCRGRVVDTKVVFRRRNTRKVRRHGLRLTTRGPSRILPSSLRPFCFISPQITNHVRPLVYIQKEILCVGGLHHVTRMTPATSRPSTLIERELLQH